MKTLRDFGAISSWQDFMTCPLGLIEDAVLLTEAWGVARKMQAQVVR